MNKISFTLPWPPSINKLYGNRTPKKGIGGYGFRYMTKEGKKYVRDALILIYSQVKKPHINGKVSVKRVLCIPDRRKRDTGNLLKMLDDVLVKAGLIEDDDLIWHCESDKIEPEKPGYVEILIEKL